MYVDYHLNSVPAVIIFFFNDTATPEIYTLSLHDALPICADRATSGSAPARRVAGGPRRAGPVRAWHRSPGGRARAPPTRGGRGAPHPTPARRRPHRERPGAVPGLRQTDRARAMVPFASSYPPTARWQTAFCPHRSGKPRGNRGGMLRFIPAALKLAPHLPHPLAPSPQRGEGERMTVRRSPSPPCGEGVRG